MRLKNIFFLLVAVLVFAHCLLESGGCVVADGFQVLQSSSQHLDGLDAGPSLDAEVHFVFLGVWNGVTAEVDVGAKRRKWRR